MIVTSTAELAAALAASWSGRHILLDGYTGAGKTPTGIELAPLLQMPFLDLDRFVRERRDTYLASLHFENISAELQREPSIVAGVCMRRVHEQLRCPPAVHVYVKRMAAAGWGWTDEEDASLSAHFHSPFRRELANYHECDLPHRKADVIYERTEFQP